MVGQRTEGWMAPKGGESPREQILVPGSDLERRTLPQ